MIEITKHDFLIMVMTISGFLIALIVFTSIKCKFLIKNDFLDKIIENNKNHQKILQKKLINMVFGDEQAAERLIIMEKGRTPNASRMQLIRSAIERLERDRR